MTQPTMFRNKKCVQEGIIKVPCALNLSAEETSDGMSEMSRDRERKRGKDISKEREQTGPTS